VVASEVEDVAAVKDEAAGSAPTPRSTVLIVDSDASSLEFMERALSQAGLRVVATTQVGGSQGAVGLLDLRQDIHVVVIDPHSCRESAGTSFKNLHARYANHRPSLQFVLVSDPRLGDRGTDYLHLDTTDFLPKPLTRSVLLRAVIEAGRRYDHYSDREPVRAPPRVLERAPSALKNGAGREQPLELRVLQTLHDIDDFRLRALDGIVEPDATWSMLTELLRARLIRRRISVTSLCLASKSPVTTALRRIERLLETGFITYSLDPKDRRRKYIELTEDGATKIQEVVRGIARHVGTDEPSASADP
jgi:DNA-binding response OmpR family regulator